MPGCSWQLGLEPLAFLDWKKLHRLVGPIALGVLAPTGRPRDADVEEGRQKPVNAKVKGQKSEGQKDQKVKEVQSLDQEVLD